MGGHIRWNQGSLQRDNKDFFFSQKQNGLSNWRLSPSFLCLAETSNMSSYWVRSVWHFRVTLLEHSPSQAWFLLFHSGGKGEFKSLKESIAGLWQTANMLRMRLHVRLTPEAMLQLQKATSKVPVWCRVSRKREDEQTSFPYTSSLNKGALALVAFCSIHKHLEQALLGRYGSDWGRVTGDRYYAKNKAKVGETRRIQNKSPL